MSRPLTLYLLLGGLVQVAVGACSLAWAWPLFADPPFLANGLMEEYSRVRAHLSGDPAMLETLSVLRVKLQWLFLRHGEGMDLALALGAVSAVLGLISAALGVRSWIALRKLDETRV